MRNILIIIGSMKTGGAEKIMVDLIKHMNHNGIKISFLVFGKNKEGYEEEVIEMGYNVIHIRRPVFPYLSYYKELKNVNKVYGPFNICHSCTLLNSGLNFIIAHRMGCQRLICHSHSTNSGRKNSFIVRIYEKCMKYLIVKYATDYLACGIEAGNYLYGKDLFSKEGIVINNGIDLKKFMFNKRKREFFRESMGLTDKIVIGNVARIDRNKNQGFLIDIMKILVKKNPKCILLLIGDGVEKKNIQDRVKAARLEKHIFFLGVRNDVCDMLNMLDVFVLPSHYEGFPLSLIEAQANGLPIVVSDTITKEIKIGENCYFLNLKAGSETWAETLLANATKERKIVELATKMKEYDINVCAEKLEKIYNS